MVIENNTLLFFSGTGNSLQVSKDICNNVGGLELLKLSSLINEENIVVKSEVLGIVFPVYYARLPLVVEKIVKKLEFSNDTYIFAVSTHGGAPAMVLKKLQALLQSKGVLLNAGFLVQMPKNHVFEYSTKPFEVGDKVFVREKEKVERISNLIRNKRDYECEVSKLIIDTIVDKVFISATNKIMETINIKDSEFWVSDKCNGCRLCVKICPVQNIDFEVKPVWKHKCERCTACIQFCPKEAIQWGNKTENRKRYRNPNIDIVDLI